MANELESIVQRMIDAKESEENIASVIKEYNKINAAKPPPTDFTGRPTTFGEGVMQSLTSGDAASAGMQGGLGWLKGATLDLPSTIGSGLEMIGNAITDPIGTAQSIPGGISSGLQSMWETTKQAGAKPFEFGEMMGQQTGQPLVTAGIAKGIPMLKNPVGAVAETAGRGMRKWQPLSGMMPRFADIRTLRNIERGVGGRLEQLGQRMRIPTLEGEVVPPSTRGRSGPIDATIIEDTQRALNPSNTHYNPTTFQDPIDINFGAQYPTRGAAPKMLEGRTTSTRQFNLPEENPVSKDLGKPKITPKTPTVTEPKGKALITKNQMNNTTLSYMKEKGFELVGLDEKGNFKFEKR